MKYLKNLFLVISLICMSILVSCGSGTKSTNAVNSANEKDNANIKLFNAGIYEGKINSELTSIYVFYEDGEGGTEFNLDGMGLPFAYEVKELDNATGETNVLFHMGDAGDNTYVKAKAISETEYKLGVYTLKLIEKDTSEEKVDEILKKYSK